MINLHEIYGCNMTTIADSLNTDLKPFDITEKIVNVQDFFAEVGYSHFPVLDDNIYLGCISSHDVDGFDIKKSIDNYRYTLDGFFAKTNMEWIDVMQIFAKTRANIMPVLGLDNQYLGYYELEGVTKIFAETPFMAEPGNIIVVEKEILSYSMSQIVQIVESNKTELLGCFVSKSTANTIQITMKVRLGGINEILQALRRYDYEIISIHEEDIFIHDLRERSEYLEKYLSI